MPEPEAYRDCVTRCRSALNDLPANAREDAERALQLVSERAGDGIEDEAAAKRELLGLIERLGRRASAAVPFASLARALSADLHGSRAVMRESLDACERALVLRGL
ncbi:MAG: hypothetical protein R3B40_02535 [Polyangiales bacterium]|nr:hypothetical protein [Myxococcales bacterium]MCB9657050.1 hypothetical protein [Sandaracinaceae bacterium]